jgi:hypothetical protein
MKLYEGMEAGRRLMPLRQAELKVRREAAGLVRVTLWALPDERRLIREYAAKLFARRRAP